MALNVKIPKINLRELASQIKGLLIKNTGLNTGDQVSGDFDLTQLINYVPSEHIDWTNTSDSLTTTGNVTCSDLVVNGTTTTINSVTLTIDDKNIEIGAIPSPSDVSADGGGITLKGSVDKTIIWETANNYWNFNNSVHVQGNITLTGTLDSRDISADGVKLDNIENNATRDQTAAEIEGLLSHDNLQNIPVHEHLDWTTDQAANNINVNNVPEAGNANTLENNTLANVLSTAEGTSIAIVIAMS